MKKAIAVAAITAVTLGGAWTPMVYAADKGPQSEQKVKMDEVPTPVKATLAKEAQGGQLGDVTKETKDGKTYYEARITKDGKDRYVNVAPDGKVLKRQSEKQEMKETKPNK